MIGRIITTRINTAGMVPGPIGGVLNRGNQLNSSIKQFKPRTDEWLHHKDGPEAQNHRWDRCEQLHHQADHTPGSAWG